MVVPEFRAWASGEFRMLGLVVTILSFDCRVGGSFARPLSRMFYVQLALLVLRGHQTSDLEGIPGMVEVQGSGA